MKKLYKLLLLLFVFVSFLAEAQNRRHIDSLITVCKTAPDDTSKVVKLNDIATYFYGRHNDSAFDFINQASEISHKHNFYGGIAYAYLLLGEMYMQKGDNKLALDYLLKSLDVAEKNGKTTILGDVYDNLSTLYRQSMKNDTKALEYSTLALQIRREGSNKLSIAISLVNMGNVYYDMNNLPKALENFTEALDLVNALKNKGNLSTEADIENNIGSVYTDLKNYDSAVAYFNMALVIYDQRKDSDGVATTYCNIGNIKNMNGNPDEGVKDAMAGLMLARKMKDKDNDIIEAAYTFLAEGYAQLGDYKKALDYETALSNFKDTAFAQAGSKQVNELQVKYDSEKKEKENQILELNNKKQKIISYSIAIGLLLVAGLAFFIYRGFKDKQKAHDELAEKNKIIEEKNKDIVDSINYAKRIQHALLTTDEYLKDSLGDYFVLYKPRDVVSGDFYWCYNTRNKVIFTVADCTGHGVPGAFMSMIGISLLNEIIIENKIDDAAAILNALRTNLLKTLQQKEKGQGAITRDGMDIALCVWDKTKNEIQFAGANNPMYIVRKSGHTGIAENNKLRVHNNHLYEILPDKQPIGFMEEKMDSLFTSQTIKVEKGDIIYISTDGYHDQFGGESNKKFTKRKFREMLASFNGTELNGQKLSLDTTIEQWKNINAQTDDICMIGVKIS